MRIATISSLHIRVSRSPSSFILTAHPHAYGIDLKSVSSLQRFWLHSINLANVILGQKAEPACARNIIHRDEIASYQPELTRSAGPAAAFFLPGATTAN